MSLEVTLQQLECGPKLTLNFMVACNRSDLESGVKMTDAVTEPINVKNFALVQFKFQYARPKQFYNLISTLSTKKHESHKYSTVKINITCDSVEKECICLDDWTEYELISKQRDCYDTVVTTSLQVNITAQDTSCLVLQSLKLYEDDEFTDFQLHAADGTVAVHKSVMAIHSDVFKTMLRGKEWEETKQGTIDLAGVTLQTLQHLKSYMYLGTLPDEGLEDLLVLAALYMVETLKADCIRKLVENVTPENLDSLIKLACQNNMPDLVRRLIYHYSKD